MSADAETPPADGRQLLVAEFVSAEDLTHAVEKSRGVRCRHIETFTPFPMPEMDALLRPAAGRIGAIAFFGGLAGAVVIYAAQYYIAVIDYPINVGGRPLHSWPAFLPMTVALALLGAALATFAGLLWEAGLPRYHHPVADAPAFERASQDRFFLCLEMDPERHDMDEAEAVLREAQPVRLDRLPV